MAILIILCLAFQQFPVMNHMLPHASNSGLNYDLANFKDFIYSPNFRDNLVFVLSVVIVGFFLLRVKGK
jgi:histone acetyltransferase (RNA polymerase elongator complex component)